jgi:hypothetical protein
MKLMPGTVDRKGFICVLVGGCLGGFAGLWGGALASFAVPYDFEGFEDLGFMVVVAVIGGWIASVAGAAALLALFKAGATRTTAAWMALFVPVIVGSGAILAIWRADSGHFGYSYLPTVIFVTAVLLTAYLSRRLGRAWDK